MRANERRLAILLAGTIIGMAALPSAGDAASFNCAKATLPDEIAVCANPDLNDADVEMATRYSMLLQLMAMGSAGAMRDGQKAWLAWRKACGSDVACLRNAYRVRIGAFKSAFQRVVARGPF